MTVRVVACDEHTLMRAGVRALLEHEADLELVKDVGDPEHLVRAAQRLRPDVILLGLPVNGHDPVTVVRRLAAGTGARRVIALAGVEDEPHLVGALRAGLRGVVRKDGPEGDLVQAIRAVLCGAASLTPSMTARLLDWVATATPRPVGRTPVITGLSERELQVLTLVADGISDRQVAHDLNVSTATVRSHLHHVQTKLGVRGRVQAVAFAYRHCMVGPYAVVGHNE